MFRNLLWLKHNIFHGLGFNATEMDKTLIYVKHNWHLLILWSTVIRYGNVL
jgi:hypothetical protein